MVQWLRLHAPNAERMGLIPGWGTGSHMLPLRTHMMQLRLAQPNKLIKNKKEREKAFLSDQCREIEENNRMGETRDLFKKIRYQGNISCKDGFDKGQKWYGPNRSRRY